jgi:hypothetical protein
MFAEHHNHVKNSQAIVKRRQQNHIINIAQLTRLDITLKGSV